MALSTAGLIGAALALAAGLWSYRLVVGSLEARLRALDRSETPAERAEFEGKLVTMRRIIFWTNMAALPVMGYTVGAAIAG